MADDSSADSVAHPSPADLLRQTQEVYGSGLAKFQKNHDICTASGFFPNNVVVEMDGCALSFRSLGLESTAAARVVSDQWIDSVILTYESIEYFSELEAKQQLELFSDQARELSLIFKVISAWSNDLAKRIKTAATNVHAEVAIFTETFQQDMKTTESELEAAKDKLKTAKEDLESKIAESDRWKYAMIGTTVGYAIFFPVGALATIITGSGYGAAQAAVHSAKDAKLEAEKDQTESQRKFDAAKSKSEKAKVYFNSKHVCV